ncbi:DUF445 domain-containing protein [Rhodocaloribacter litoris]|uniref:DUF445 domain-containing protein n=1 Tax=Rhodocaloribacter litoris TaxID=2558931 RepID=UPI00141FE8DE|nr:DUF445 family protein [Rhodocaloribacter litoris]QXD16535.1 DUF445 domain-containing protein [Rhodocaloribacter litoris]
MPQEPSSPPPVPEPDTPEPAVPAASVPEAREITRARARDLRDLLARYVRRHLPPRPPAHPRIEEPPRLVGTHARLLPFLRLVPLLLALLFGFSFVWDFPGMTATAFGRTLALDGLLRILSVSGLIGFATNWLAITMLFHPRRKRPVFGQGLIPAQRERIVYRLARAVSEELINEEIIKQKIEEHEIIPKYREMALRVTRGVIEDPGFRTELKALTADYVERVLASEAVRRRLNELIVQKIEEHAGDGLGGLALKAYRFLNEEDFKRRIDRAIHNLPASLDAVLDEFDHLLDRVPVLIEARAEDIEAWATRLVLGFVENLDVHTMIMSNMMQYDERRLEDLLKKTTNEQLNYIKYLGGVLGFFGGLVIWEPLLALAAFGALGLLLWTVDAALFRLTGR